MKKLVLVVVALVAVGAALAEPLPADPDYGPDFWFNAMVVYEGLVQVDYNALEKYGLTDHQMAQFVEAYERISATHKRKIDNRVRAVCDFKGSQEQFYDFMEGQDRQQIDDATEAANALKAALDQATVLALSAETSSGVAPTQKYHVPASKSLRANQIDPTSVQARYCDSVRREGEAR